MSAGSSDIVSSSSDSWLSSLSSPSSLVSKSFVSLVWSLGSIVAGVVAVVAGLLYAKQDSLLYFPEIGGIPRRPSQNPRGYRNPQERNIPYQDCRIPCADGVYIHAWLLLYQPPQQQPSSTTTVITPTIIFFHGNAGNIGIRLPNAHRLMQATRSNILLVDYRGYGESDSVPPNEAGLKLDAQGALHFCLQHPLITTTTTSKPPIFLFGRSLGGAVAFSLALYAQQHQLPLAGIMVENTFTSISDMVDHLMPWLAPFKALVLRISWDSTKIIPQLVKNNNNNNNNYRLPMLFLAGSADELVPPSHMSKLVELATQHGNPNNNNNYNNVNDVSLHVIPGGTHNECWVQGGEPYWNALAKFVHENTKKFLQQQNNNGGSASATSASSDYHYSAAATTTPTQPLPPFSTALSTSTTTTKTTPSFETDVVVNSNNPRGDETCSIPTMSTRLVDMVNRREAVDASLSSTTPQSKKEI